MKLWPNAELLVDKLHKPNGRLIPNYPLASSSWFRVGGLAEVMFFPEDVHDLAIFLQKLPKDASPIRMHNRCKLTGRPKGYMRQFGISRVMFREMANFGLIPGVKKASW